MTTLAFNEIVDRGRVPRDLEDWREWSLRILKLYSQVVQVGYHGTNFALVGMDLADFAWLLKDMARNIAKNAYRYGVPFDQMTDNLKRERPIEVIVQRFENEKIDFWPEFLLAMATSMGLLIDLVHNRLPGKSAWIELGDMYYMVEIAYANAKRELR